MIPEAICYTMAGEKRQLFDLRFSTGDTLSIRFKVTQKEKWAVNLQGINFRFISVPESKHSQYFSTPLYAEGLWHASLLTDYFP
jgi:hypothetical protein